MKKIFKLILASLMVLSMAACATVPGTGRSQLSLVSDAELNQMAAVEYKSMTTGGHLSADKKDTAMIKNVGARISKAAEKFLVENNMAADIPNYKWEFNLIESSDVNAFCMPGGKVAFFTGILPYCQGEGGVAAIMGHEVAHAIARHSNERASQQLMTQLGATALSLGLGVGGASSLTSDMAMAAYGLGSEVGVLLPFSRSHESEADRIGLTLMAMAGYDPKEAVAFWTRMAADSGGKSGPAFLSTHPSDQKRIKDIEKYLPEAEAKYVPVQTGKASGKKKKQ